MDRRDKHPLSRNRQAGRLLDGQLLIAGALRHWRQAGQRGTRGIDHLFSLGEPCCSLDYSRKGLLFAGPCTGKAAMRLKIDENGFDSHACGIHRLSHRLTFEFPLFGMTTLEVER